MTDSRQLALEVIESLLDAPGRYERVNALKAIEFIKADLAAKVEPVVMTMPQRIALANCMAVAAIASGSTTPPKQVFDRVMNSAPENILPKVNPVGFVNPGLLLPDDEDEKEGWAARINSRRTDIFSLPVYTSPQQAVPAGFVLVPIEPTREMLHAPTNAWAADALVTYRAMLEAAPRPAS